MRGFDTNLLTRLITKDDVKQAAKVLDLIHHYRALDQKIYIDDVAICELVWVLGSAYKYTRSQVCVALNILLVSDDFVFRNVNSLQNAFKLYQSGNADFADYFMYERSKEFGCDAVYSFDKQPIKEGVFISCDI